MGICETHGEYPDTTDEGRAINDCPKCEEERKERLRQECRQRDRLRFVAAAGIPPRYRLRSFDNYRATTDGQRAALNSVFGYAKTFPQRRAEGRNLILCGSVGTGKTHLATALVRAVIESHTLEAVYSSAQAISLRVRATYDKAVSEDYQKVIAHFARPPLLVVDEIGVQSNSDHEKRIFYDLINSRYEQMSPTVLIGNMRPNEFEKWLGIRAMDRLQEGGCDIVQFDWSSYRHLVAQDENLPTAEKTAEAVAHDEDIRQRKLQMDRELRWMDEHGAAY